MHSENLIQLVLDNLSQRETQLDQSDVRIFAWVNKSLLDLTSNSQLTFYHDCFKKKQSLEVVSLTLILNTFSSLFFLHKSENTRWLLIEKTMITTYNQLNIQYNWLFRRSNRLHYHFNRLKCSSQHLENSQEQCNQLDSWCNWLKYSWSLLGTPLKTM